MGGIHRPADKKVYIGRFFKENARDFGGSVLTHAPFAVKRVVTEIVFRILKHAIDGYNAFGYQIDAFNFGGWRYLRVEIEQTCAERLFQKLCCYGRGGASAYDVFALFGEKNSDIILSQSSLFDGGPISRFTGSRFLISTVQTVASSPGLPS
jgi:hypothetical protein